MFGYGPGLIGLNRANVVPDRVPDRVRDRVLGAGGGQHLDFFEGFLQVILTQVVLPSWTRLSRIAWSAAVLAGKSSLIWRIYSPFSAWASLLTRLLSIGPGWLAPIVLPIVSTPSQCWTKQWFIRAFDNSIGTSVATNARRRALGAETCVVTLILKGHRLPLCLSLYFGLRIRR